MSFNQKEIIDRFMDGKTNGTASNMFIKGDVMYSYGRHFPLLVRTPWGNVLNADKYSVTTSQHQSLCSKAATIQIPFSALSEAMRSTDGYSSMSLYSQSWSNVPNADKYFEAIELIARASERYDTVGWKTPYGAAYKRISPEQFKALKLPPDQLDWERIEERRPEAAVLKVGGDYFLSSMDGNNYFISKLPEPADTVEEAFASLMPQEVKGLDEIQAEKYLSHRTTYVDVQVGQYARQGEWFFVPAVELPTRLKQLVEARLRAVNAYKARTGKNLSREKMERMLYDAMQHDFVLPRPDSSSHTHTATRGTVFNETLYVSGSVKHEEHRMLRLSKASAPRVFLAYRNRAVNSWSASGRVD